MDPAVKDFHHPYKPYDIQFELMNVIYDCIAEGKVGILESPTGTHFWAVFVSRLTLLPRNCMSNEQSHSSLLHIQSVAFSVL